MRHRHFYKLVRINGDHFTSIYRANPQKYFLNQRIDCPYMFVYEPGCQVGELTIDRAESGLYALLKVRAECEPKQLWLRDISWAINGLTRHTSSSSAGVIEESICTEHAIHTKRTTLLDSLTPLSCINLGKLRMSEFGTYYAPGKKKEATA